MVDEKADVAAFKDYKQVIKNIEDSILPPKVGGDVIPAIKQIETLDYTKHKVNAPSENIEVVPRTGDKIFISPFAKKTAEEKGVDYSTIVGTGPRGRIVNEDILNHLASAGAAGVRVEKVVPVPQQVNVQAPAISAPVQTPSPSGNYQDVEVSNMRKVIAERLVLSKTTIPHFYITVECNMDEIIR